MAISRNNRAIRALTKAHHRQLKSHHTRAHKQLIKHFHKIRNAPSSYKSGKAPAKRSSGSRMPSRPAGLTAKAGAGWKWLKSTKNWFKNLWGKGKKHAAKHGKAALAAAKKEGKNI